jgi:hypothetical protein
VGGDSHREETQAFQEEARDEAEVSTQQHPSISLLFLAGNAGCFFFEKEYRLFLPSARSSPRRARDGFLFSILACVYLNGLVPVVVFWGALVSDSSLDFSSLTAQLSFVCHSSSVLAAHTHTHDLLEQASPSGRGRVGFRQLKPCYAAKLRHCRSTAGTAFIIALIRSQCVITEHAEAE